MVIQLSYGNVVFQLLKTQRPVLLGCFSRNASIKEHVAVLERVASAFDDFLKVCFVESDSIKAFSDQYNINGTPTFLIFKDGNEQGRLLGKADSERITAFVKRTLPFVTQVPEIR